MQHMARPCRFRPHDRYCGSWYGSSPVATMLHPMKPWTFFLAAVSGWMNRRQQEVTEFLKEEGAVLSAGVSLCDA